MNPLNNVPNVLTFARILLIPVFVMVYYLPFTWAHFVAAVIFALGGVTDWLDGFFARKLEQFSPFGAFLDPVADKLQVTTTLILLLGEPDLHFMTLPAIVIVGREIVISSLREWMAHIGERTSVAVNYIGKVKTAMQMFALLLLVAYKPWVDIWGTLGFLLLYLAVFLTIWSMIMYIRAAWPELTKKE